MKITSTFNDVIGRVSAPPVVENLNQGDATGVTGINNFLTTVVSLFFLLASIALVFMVIWGAYDYIISFGEKENISKAKQKITWAIVGFIILSLSFVIFKVLEQITGVKFLII